MSDTAFITLDVKNGAIHYGNVEGMGYHLNNTEVVEITFAARTARTHKVEVVLADGSSAVINVTKMVRRISNSTRMF